MGGHKNKRMKSRPSAPRRHVCDEHCEHYRTDREKTLIRQIQALLETGVEPRTRADVEGSSIFVDVHIRCSGKVPLTCYHCALKPNHAGECFSAIKNVHFIPEAY